MFNAPSAPPAPAAALNPYYFSRDHGPPPSGYSSGPPSSGDFPLPASAAPAASTIQDRGVAPASSAPLDGARLMALLTTQSAAAGGGEDEVGTALPDLDEGKFATIKPPPMPTGPPMPTCVPNSLAPAPLPKTLQDSKLPRGRVLKGERIVYDVDVRKADEAQPQLEVRPITTYGSDPAPILGRQIAVNMHYICYGLRAAAIRIINLNAELRALLRGHTGRVTDMAFAADNVNSLASASTDGRVFVRHIMESRVPDGKIAIQEHIVAAVHFIGNWESCNPRICWQKQDFLLVAIGKYILSIDLNKVQQAAPVGGFTTEKTAVCHMKDLIEGITIIGEHEEDVTDLAIPPHSSSHIASSSADGLVRVWGLNKSGYLSSFAPHMGDIVGAVAFLSAPGFPENSVLLTAGYQMNRELKLWAPEESASPSKSGSQVLWECIQTIEFQSSADGEDVDNAFFNQVAVAHQNNLIVVANARKHAIYVLHVQFGSRLERAQVNYLAEFSVTIPILSLTVKEQRGAEGGPGAAVQIYCVQTAAIQQYTLLVSQCLPMSVEKPGKQASPVVDKAAVKVVTSAPVSTPQAPSEKIAPNVNAPVNDGGSAPGSAPNVPPGYEQRVAAGFENLLDGGQPQPMTEMAKLIASTKLSASEIAATLADDSKSSGPPISAFTQTGAVKGPSSQGDKSVPKYEAEKPTNRDQVLVAPVKILSRPRSPAKNLDQRFVPVSAGLSVSSGESVEENRQRSELNFSPGGLRRESPAITDESSNVKGNGQRSTGLGRQASGSFEKEGDYRDDLSAPSGFRRSQPELRGESGRIEQPTQSSAPALDGTSPFSSMESATHSSIEEEEQRGTFNTFSAGVRNTQNHHLITPKELMSLVDGSKPAQAGAANSEVDGPEAGATRQGAEIESVQLETVNFPLPPGAQQNTSRESEASKELHASDFESNEQDLLSQVDGPPSQEYGSPEYGHSDFNSADDEGLMDASADDGLDHSRDRNAQLSDLGSESGVSSQASAVTKQRKNKNKTSGGMIVPPASALLPVPSTLSPVIVSESQGAGSWNSGTADTGLAVQVALMQESLNQLVNMQSELQKQMSVMVSVPVVKEGKRLEVAVGQRMEKVLKAHVDAMGARLAEENAKREKVEKERLQQITTLLNNFFNKEMPAVIERGMKKEFLALIPTISQAILPPIQKAISTGINESFQKGIADKLLPQLERLILTKLEVSISRQLQAQFQTVGKQALQDAIRTSFEGYIIPTFEHSCRTMFEQVDTVFKRGMEEHVLIAQQQFSSMHSPLASTLQETVSSASALAQSLKGELAESNKRLAALVENSTLGAVVGANRNETTAFLDKILSLQHVEETIDPTVKLTKFLKEDKLEEAFHMALSADDVDLVAWLCNQIDPMAVFQRSPLPLGQTVLLSLVQQLGVEIEKDTKGKLRWIQEAVLCLNPKDPTVAGHVRGILEQVLSNLQRQTNIAGPGDLSNQMRLVTHVVNSMLTACK